jgi:hypothetical protein
MSEDTKMVIAGVLLSLIAAAEVFPIWQRLRRKGS